MKRIIVTGLPNVPGAIFEGHELIAAMSAAIEAKAMGLEGKVITVEDDDKVRELNTATLAKSATLAKAPWTP